MFARLIAGMGGRVANSSLDNGAYQLDRQGGGWRIEQITNTGGAVREVTMNRMTSLQLMSHMQFALNVLTHVKDNAVRAETDVEPIDGLEPDVMVMKTIYTRAGVAKQVDRMLELAKHTKIPSMDYDMDWDMAEGDDRCTFCVENKIENCRHVGM